MAVIGVVVIGGLTLALVGYPSLRVVSVARKTEPEAPAQPVHVAALVQPEPPRPAPPASPVATPAAAPATTHAPTVIVQKPKETSGATTRSLPADPVPPPARAAATVAEATHETVAPEPTPNVSVAAPAVMPDTTSQPVTISGCLEISLDEDQFRLTDTEGADTPKARSWRSGFLKKRAAAVELVDVSDPAGLKKSVGRRVMATGLLTGRELHVRSLQAAGSSCK